MIIILGSEYDAHCRWIANKLDEKSEPYKYFNTSEFPSNAFINWNIDTKNNGYLKLDNEKISFSDIKSVYWRNYLGIMKESHDRTEEGKFLYNMLYRERESAIFSLFYSLNTNWCNSPRAFELHKKKAYLLNLFRKNNIRIPKTLITNDKDAIREFYEKNNKQIIYKPVLGGAYTKKMNEDDFSEQKLDTLKTAPVQFQEYIDGVDIRVYAFKDKIFALKIEAQGIDFREDANIKLAEIELPDNVREDCYRVMDLCDLKYSGIDIRKNSNGEYVFIEANPAPMFIGVQNSINLPLGESLVELLIN